MIIQNLVEDVVLRLNRDDDNVRTRAVDWLMEAYTCLAAEYPFVEMQQIWQTTSGINATAADRRFYPLPAFTRAILMVDFSDDRQSIIRAPGVVPYHRNLKKTSYREIFGYYHGVPRQFFKYSRWANCLIVDSPPDRDDYGLTLFLWMYPDTSTRELSTILIPEEWHEIMIWGSVWRGHNENLEYERAKQILDGVLYPLIQPKLTKLKAFLETQDWDISFRFLQQKYTPVV